MFLYIVFSMIFICLVDYFWKKPISDKLPPAPGPFNLPLLGGIWLWFNRSPDDLLNMTKELRNRYGRTVKTWIINIPSFYTSDMKYVQEILSHPVEIKKNRLYALLGDWLGEGLLMSNGTKWLSRRRVITPTFHFKILEEFAKIFDEQAVILSQKLIEHADTQECFNIQNFIALATLDVICETAMGVKINAQIDEECEYVKLLLEMTDIISTRFAKIPFRSDLLFKIFAPKLSKRRIFVRNKLHEFTNKIISERRLEILEKDKEFEGSKENREFGIKSKMALLDVLLLSKINDQPLTDADIREEVDTFMFEGHDTTKSGIGFTLWSISREKEVQEKLYDEIVKVLGIDLAEPITYRQLMDLKYMEKVIREGLRMYPPVPFIGRQITHDCKIGQGILPKGTSVLLSILAMHNDPEYFIEPEKFLPDRPGNENAFAFVPFSAGPRNCIGQRFAMLEMKAMIARIVQRYELLPLGDPIDPTIRVVLKSNTGWQMGFRSRA